VFPPPQTIHKLCRVHPQRRLLATASKKLSSRWRNVLMAQFATSFPDAAKKLVRRRRNMLLKKKYRGYFAFGKQHPWIRETYDGRRHWAHPSVRHFTCVGVDTTNTAESENNALVLARSRISHITRVTRIFLCRYEKKRRASERKMLKFPLGDDAVLVEVRKYIVDYHVTRYFCDELNAPREESWSFTPTEDGTGYVVETGP